MKKKRFLLLLLALSVAVFSAMAVGCKGKNPQGSGSSDSVEYFDYDNYYLVCYYGKYEGVVHYRIDRMDHVQMVADQPREPYKGEAIDLKRHKKTLFGMFQGEEQLVEFQADESILDPIFDIFGDKVEITPDENGKLRFKAAVQLSPTFYGWCLSFRDKLQVVGPNEVVEKVVEYIQSLTRGYKLENKGE